LSAAEPRGGKLARDQAALVVIDIQEAFRKAVPAFDGVAGAIATLVRGADVLGVPVVVTEQYPKGLGATVPEVAELLPDGSSRLEKSCFSAAEADGFDLDGRRQAIVCGIEAHVCVGQTVLDLLGEDVDVHLVADAVGSRDQGDAALALRRAERAGATLTSVETVLFELLRGSDAPEFKAVQELVK
jgi:nicotinamidase-related amidase